MEKVIPNTTREKMIVLKYEVEELRKKISWEDLTNLLLNWLKYERSPDYILINKFGYKTSEN